MVARGEYRALCGKKNERVLDFNASCSVSLSCLFQTCQDLKGNFAGILSFFSSQEERNVANTDVLQRQVAMLTTPSDAWVVVVFLIQCFFPSSFLPLFSFFVVIFYGWQMKVVLASSNSRHRRTGISFRSLFMYILGTISEGFQRVASHCADRTCLYLVRLENYGAHDPANVFIE